MTVYEVLCLMQPTDTVELVDTRETSNLYTKFNYKGLVKDLPFRPDVWNHVVYNIKVNKNIVISFNQVGLATGITVFDILSIVDKSQQVSICSGFPFNDFSGKISDIPFDTDLLSRTVESIRAINASSTSSILQVQYYVFDPHCFRYETFRVL